MRKSGMMRVRGAYIWKNRMAFVFLKKIIMGKTKCVW